MSPAEPFQLIYDPEVLAHLQSIERKFYPLIRNTIREQLSFEPQRQTRNRKPLKPPMILGGEWVLRFGPDNRFRVFYRVDASRHEVHVLAIGIKKGSSLFVGRLEVKL